MTISPTPLLDLGDAQTDRLLEADEIQLIGHSPLARNALWQEGAVSTYARRAQ